MTYIRAEIEQCPAYGWQAKPAFKTLIVPMANGRENRNAEIAQAQHAYSAPFLNIDPADYRNIKQMHYVCRGMLHVFQFKDQLDYQASNEFFGVGDGTTTVFQLAKISTIGGVQYSRYVYVIKPGVVIKNNGATVSPTIDYDRGTVTFGTAPIAGHSLTWTGEFRIWVRFNSDDLPFTLDSIRAVNGTIDLLEQPPPGVGQ